MNAGKIENIADGWIPVIDLWRENPRDPDTAVAIGLMIANMPNRDPETAAGLAVALLREFAITNGITS